MTRLARVGLATASVTLLASGCGGDPREAGSPTPSPAPTAEVPEDTPTPTRSLRLELDDLEPGALGPQQDLLGGADAGFRLAATGRGSVEVVEGRDGRRALRFPAHQPAGEDRAVLVVAPEGELGPEPGADFRLAVSFSLDTVSEGGSDNGNNLVQRGLFADAAQYKLQVDKGTVSCRLRGDAGELVVRSETRVTPGAWYDVTCDRVGESVLLEVTGPEGRTTHRAEGRVGRIAFAPGTPLAVGGKVGPQGQPVVADSDQLNGLVDGVALRPLG